MFRSTQIFRYYINCTQCNRNITIKEVYKGLPHVDGCIVEFGATRSSLTEQFAGIKPFSFYSFIRFMKLDGVSL